MGHRQEELKVHTLKLLGRLNAPRAVQNNDENMKSEAEFLCNQIVKLAPSKNYNEWFDDFEQNLLSNLETRTWPTAKEISKSAKAIAPKRPEFRELQPEKYEPNELKINADRINNGEQVGESYIIGTLAEQMVRVGLVQEAQLQPYKEYLKNMKKN
tara:strand:+ start:2380 stop:2847 length:468 start_codon:yes stop_codon:yes gene_type:complete